MTIELFQDFTKIIKPAFSDCKRNSDFEFEYDILCFLLCDKQFQKVDHLTSSPALYKKLYNGTLDLSRYYGPLYPQLLQANEKLTLSDLISFKKCDLKKLLSYQDNLLSLCQKYKISISPDTEAEQIYKLLFKACIYEKPKYLFASYKNQQLKPSTMQNTIGFSYAADDLLKQLNKHSKILISSNYGDGKTHFIKYCLTKWKLSDYYYIDYKYSLDATLKAIPQQDNYGLKKSGVSVDELTDPQYSSSLLVIDHMYYPDDYQAELDLLASLAIKVIIITVSRSPADAFFTFSFPKLEETDLKLMFETYASIQIMNECTWNHIKQVTQLNPLMLSLLAKQFYTIMKVSEKQPQDTLEELLITLSRTDNHLNIEPTAKTKFKHPYDLKTLDIIGHFKQVYRFINKPNSQLQKQLLLLCYFGWSPIPENFCKEILPNYSREKIQQLEDMGFLVFEQNSIHLSPLIIHSVIAVENPQPNDEDVICLRDNLLEFLLSYNKTLEVSFLGDLLWHFIETFYDNIKYNTNTNYSKTSSTFEKWQDLIYAIYNYYFQTGEYYYAEEIRSRLRYPENAESKRNSIDPSYFHLGTVSQQPESIPRVGSLIDELIKTLQNDRPSLKNHSLNHVVTSSLDTALGLYSLAYISLDDKQRFEQLTKYQRIIKRLFGDISKQEESILSEELFSFYKICISILIEQSLSFKILNDCFMEIKEWQYREYRLKGISFLTIIQSIFICQEPSWSSEDKYNAFNDYLMEPLKMLKADISSCKLIPIHTFRLCIYAYIAVAMVLYQYKCSSSSSGPLPFTFADLQHLFLCGHLSQDEYNAAITGISKILELLQESENS